MERPEFPKATGLGGAGFLLGALLFTALPMIAAEPSEPAAEAINTLGIELLSKAAKPGENTAISPYSIQAALVMVYAGAEGETREQMAKVLHLPKDPVPAFAGLQKQLSALPKELNVNVANRLFGQKGYEFRSAYLALVKDEFHAPLEQLDFAQSQAATKTINAWVEKETRDRIRNLIPEGVLDEASRLVLVNAIYLKAPWQDTFNRGATSPQLFHLAGGKEESVPTMVRKSRYGYRKQNGHTEIALPYEGGVLQFVILLPDAAAGLPALEKKLTPALLADCARLPAQDVLLYLPKFKIEPPLFQLSEALQSLGMKSAFDIPSGSANFNGIAPRKPDDYLFISDVLHKTFVDVNEDGTEAAAATAVVMRAGSAMPKEKPVEVRVDRPFLFAIQHRASGACLFLGRVTHPR